MTLRLAFKVPIFKSHSWSIVVKTVLFYCFVILQRNDRKLIRDRRQSADAGKVESEFWCL